MIEFFTSSTFQTVLSALNSGFLKTLQLFFITLIGALPLGLVISFGSMSRLAPFARPVHWFLRRQKRAPGRIAKALIAFRPIRLICRLVVWVIRGTPLVLQIIALFYVPGIQRWFSWPSGESGRMMAVCVAFIINYACYFSEIYRGGIQGVPKGQQEAGQVLGMTKSQIFRHIKTTTHHSATLFRGTGLYNGEERDLIYSVIDSNQVKQVTRAVREIDPNAFINVIKTNQVSGNFYRKPND